MSQVNEAVADKVTEQDVETTTNEQAQDQVTPIFEEVEQMNPGMAVDILIQAASMAQGSGALTVRDSVMLAKAISVLRPGSI